MYRRNRVARGEFLLRFPYCAFCGTSHELDVHEILAGSFRFKAFERRETWLPACSDCNCNKATDRELWPVVLQLWLKLNLDPEAFNLDAINEIYAPSGTLIPPQVVTAAEVLEAGREYLLREFDRAA